MIAMLKVQLAGFGKSRQLMSQFLNGWDGEVDLYNVLIRISHVEVKAHFVVTPLLSCHHPSLLSILRDLCSC